MLYKKILVKNKQQKTNSHWEGHKLPTPKEMLNLTHFESFQFNSSKQWACPVLLEMWAFSQQLDRAHVGTKTAWWAPRELQIPASTVKLPSCNFDCTHKSTLRNPQPFQKLKEDFFISFLKPIFNISWSIHCLKMTVLLGCFCFHMPKSCHNWGVLQRVQPALWQGSVSGHNTTTRSKAAQTSKWRHQKPYAYSSGQWHLSRSESLRLKSIQKSFLHTYL